MKRRYEWLSETARSRREADRFFADLMGVPPRRRAPVGRPAIDVPRGGIVDLGPSEGTPPAPRAAEIVADAIEVGPVEAAAECGCSQPADPEPPTALRPAEIVPEAIEPAPVEAAAECGCSQRADREVEEGERWDDPAEDDGAEADGEDDEAEDEPAEMRFAGASEDEPAEAAPPPTHCFEISTFRAMDLTADGAVSSGAVATPTTPPDFTAAAPTRFRTVAGLDANFPTQLEATAAPAEILMYTHGRVLLDTGHLRVDPADASLFQVRVRGLACHPSEPGHPEQLPAGTERCPVVILVHGQHASLAFDLADSGGPRAATTLATSGGPMPVTLIPARATLRHEVRSDRGYRYLQEHLAGLGVVSVSVDTNAANLTDSLVRFRADLVLEMLDHLRALDATPGSPFHRRLDFSRVGLVGHSRGGDAVAMAADLNRARPSASRYGVRAVVALAPTDFTGMLAPESARLKMTAGAADSFLCVYGSHDGDVSGGFRAAERCQGWSFTGTGFRHYDRATTQRAMVFLHGATHNRFNSVWIDPAAHPAGSPARTLAEAQADNAVDAPSVDPRLPSSSAFPLPGAHRDARVLSQGEHETLAREYVGGWLSLWLRLRWSEARRFTGADPNSLGAPVALQWKLGVAGRSIDNFDDANPARNVSGGSVTLPVFVRERLVELTDLGHSPHHDRALEAGPPIGAVRVYRSRLPAGGRAFTGFSALTFRISKDFPDVSTPAAIAAAAFPPMVEITLFDGTRRKSVDQAVIAPLNAMTVRPYHRLMGAQNLTKVHLQTWQIPLSQFAGAGGVALGSIEAVEIAFHAGPGEPIHLDTLALVQL